jgi:hypothetical protein
LELEAKFLNRTELDLQPWMVWLIAVLACGTILFVGYRNEQESRARGTILKALEAPDNDLVVTVNGHPWSPNNAVLAMIRGVHARAAHHSGPGHEIHVVIRGKRGELQLTLARDSDVRQEYWVFLDSTGRNP